MALMEAYGTYLCVEHKGKDILANISDLRSAVLINIWFSHLTTLINGAESNPDKQCLPILCFSLCGICNVFRTSDSITLPALYYRKSLLFQKFSRPEILPATS